MPEKANHKIYIGLVISMLFWGLGWPSTKILLGYGEPLHIAVVRFLFTFFTLLIILLVLRQKLLIKKAGLPSLLLASVLISVYTLLFLVGVQRGAPGAGGILVTTLTPIATYGISILIAKRKPVRHETIGLLLGLTAACFLLHLWEGLDHILQSGNLFFLISCIVWAVLSRITARASEFGSPLTFTLWLYLSCFACLLVFSDWHQLHRLITIRDARYWINMIYNACINTGVATTFFFFATSRLGAAKTSSFIYIVPCAAAFFSWLLLGEIFYWNTIVGGILGISAVYVLNARVKGL